MQVCEEVKLYEAVLMWTQHQKFDAQQTDEALSQLLPLIRFPLMSLEELQVGCLPGAGECHLSFTLCTSMDLIKSAIMSI